MYCGNNPIVYIDPDGRDRIYHANGRFKEDTGKGKSIIVMTANGPSKLSQLAYNTGTTNKAVSRIIAHEAKLAGHKGKYGVKDMASKDTGAHTDSKNNVYVNIKQLKKGTYDNFNDLKSTLDHEANLKYGHKGENIPEDKYTYLDHANVYLGQSQEKDFKNTSEQNQYSVAVGFAERIFASTQKEAGLDIREQIGNYNSNNGTVKIDKINTNNGRATISINGQSNTIQLEIPATPHE